MRGRERRGEGEFVPCPREKKEKSVPIACVVLSVQCQRNGFSGPTIGPKPTEKNVREFSDEQLKAGQGIIGLQAGTNRCAPPQQRRVLLS